jgi:20S proteasome alpha/beta subunit
MNGGLITAIAGRDYMIMATDTRMTGSSGYDILERHHINTRLWAPTDSSSSSSSSSSSESDFIAPDGSLNINLFEEIQKIHQPHQPSPSTPMSSLRLLRESKIQSQQRASISPILIGSVGCQADCEQLKRMVRSELRTAMYFGEISIDDSVRRHNDCITSTNSISIETMAVLLSQILYSRRTFPFGCYCIMGGMSLDGKGQVYVYDAIGSYEQLAIACTGTGFELLQPILDRQFNPLISSSSLVTSSLLRGTNIRRPSSLQVDCPTVEEAIQILISAYRSVSEREIGVGDHIVFYSVQRLQDEVTNDGEKSSTSTLNESQNNRNIQFESKIWTAPLKKH